MTELKTITNTPISKKIKRKYGSTVYEVSLFFSETSREGINDKIKRLIRNDPQVSRL